MVPTPPIFTLTGNLLAERTFTYAAWAPGKTQRATQQTFQVGGKGINVTKMLGRLGCTAEALCFVGGAPGEECRAWLRTQGLPHRAFATAGATRTGLVIRSSQQPETTFLGPDVPADASASQACADFLNAQPDGLVVALCGSFPGWAEDTHAPLRAALADVARRGILYVDTYGPPLTWAVREPVACIKINRDELLGLSGTEARSASSTSDLLSRVSSVTGPRTWVVTDGPQPVTFGPAGGPWLKASPPPVQEVSATGSGDVFFAALLYARERLHLPWSEAVDYALPFGAANASHPGIAEFDLNQVSPFRSHPL